MTTLPSIKVGNISVLVSEAILKEMFSIIGEIKTFYYFPSYIEKNTFEAIVDYTNVKDIHTALYLHETVVGDRKITVTLNSGDYSIFEEKSVPVDYKPIIRRLRGIYKGHDEPVDQCVIAICEGIVEEDIKKTLAKDFVKAIEVFNIKGIVLVVLENATVVSEYLKGEIQDVK
jgi:hypothetical protein